jgi:hypothetical protein
MVAQTGTAFASSHTTTDKLLKQIVQQQKLQIQLQQDNANLAQSRLNIMTVYLNNILAENQIIAL